MNTKQIVALVVGIVVAFVTLNACTKSQVVSSHPIGPNMEVTVMEDTLPPSGSLWLIVVTAATAGAVYGLRTRKSA